MSGKFGNYFSCLDEEDQSKSVETKKPKNRFEYLSSIAINSSFDIKEVGVLKEALQTNSTITQMDVTNAAPTIVMKAIIEALQYNNRPIQLTYRETEDNLFEDQVEEGNPSNLRELLLIPRIKYDLELKENSSALQVIKSASNINIKRLVIKVNGSQLDELLEGISTNEDIEYIDIDRLEIMNIKCNKIALFGKLKKLSHLKIQIRNDECEQLSTALQNNNTLKVLYLLGSSLTPQSAKYLADLIATSNSLDILDLSKCQMDNETFSIICQGVIESPSLTRFFVLDNRFDRLDPSWIKSGSEKKKLKGLQTHIFDGNMAKYFDIHFLQHEGTNFDGLKTAKIRRLAVKTLQEAQHVTNLFNSLNFNRSIKSLTIYPDSGYTLPNEFWGHLTANKTLKHLDITYMEFNEKSFNFLCETIEKNNTLETFIHDGTFIVTAENWDFTYIPTQPLLEALKNNTNLTKVDFYRLHCEDRDLEEVLLANPYLSFIELADRKRGSRVSKLNGKNLKNINTRLRNIKCNVMTLARSYLSKTLPMELWQLILSELYNTDVDYIDLFQKSMRK